VRCNVERARAAELGCLYLVNLSREQRRPLSRETEEFKMLRPLRQTWPELGSRDHMCLAWVSGPNSCAGVSVDSARHVTVTGHSGVS